MKTIALFGGSFNPPCIHHRAIAEKLAGIFSEVILIPCGSRPDKDTPLADGDDRVEMCKLCISGLKGVSVDPFDVRNVPFTRTWKLDEMFRNRGEIWHVVGGDIVHGGSENESEIQTSWENGVEFWNNARFAVVKRPGFDVDNADLPPHSKLIELDIPGSSTEARKLLCEGKPVDNLISRLVLAYINENGLYK